MITEKHTGVPASIKQEDCWVIRPSDLLDPSINDLKDPDEDGSLNVEACGGSSNRAPSCHEYRRY